MLIARGWVLGGGNGELPNGYSLSLRKWKISEMDSDDGHTTISMYLMPFNCTLKNGKFYVMFILPQLKKLLSWLLDN